MPGFFFLTGKRGCNSYASKDVPVNSRQKRGSSYSPAGSYRTASSMSQDRSALSDGTDIAHFPTSDEPPFDRHDWIVRRSSTGEEVRYVIDYYGAPPLPDGSPVFSLDVRPALDSFGSISMRVRAGNTGGVGKGSSRDESRLTSTMDALPAI